MFDLRLLKLENSASHKSNGALLLLGALLVLPNFESKLEDKRCHVIAHLQYEVEKLDKK